MDSGQGEVPYGVIGFNEDMTITSCNQVMSSIIGINDPLHPIVGSPVMEILAELEQKLQNVQAPVKVVIVVSESCSHYLRNGYVSSARFTTLVDDSGNVRGGTIVLRKKDLA